MVNTDSVSDWLLRLPLWVGMGQREVDFVIHELNSLLHQINREV